MEHYQVNLPIDTNLNTQINNEMSSNETNFNMKLNGVNKVYSNGVNALVDYNISIKKGEIMGLLGPNGAGKSTTFNILTMREQRSSGNISILGNDIADLNQSDLINMSMCPQENMI
mmetsp:Transcript_34421/g.29027  ORF Transcript_34421/g.29027 Transcript_34421/m.29027 type:complete len:116 (+) Transcript_34421:2646-2993(+)